MFATYSSPFKTFPEKKEKWKKKRWKERGVGGGGGVNHNVLGTSSPWVLVLWQKAVWCHVMGPCPLSGWIIIPSVTWLYCTQTVCKDVKQGGLEGRGGRDGGHFQRRRVPTVCHNPEGEFDCFYFEHELTPRSTQQLPMLHVAFFCHKVRWFP